jgi:membrane glycosyltransferase
MIDVKKKSRWKLHIALRRFLLTSLVLGQTAVGSYYMASVLPYHGANTIEKSLIALFAVMFLWISVGFWMAIAGFLIRRFGGDSQSLMSRHRHQAWQDVPLAKTAIVMPIYHEDVDRTLGGLSAVYQSLEKTGQLEHFDFFILSDSRDPKFWLSEQATWYRLCCELKAFGKLFYRRRVLNMNYKSGNIADFLRRVGKGYTYTVVLDADSLMAGDTLVKMVQLMQLEPQVGILQTNPTLVNARSLLARTQQFANQVYGPLFSTGLAAFQGGEAVYWGHNAIIRTQPFMQHCGLKRLTGRGLFKGAISSHDFVEAAYIARAGYEVWLEPELTATYEETPPSIKDELARDKRWAKGNLQHIYLLLFGRRLRFAHRMAFLNGVMSYIASPLWLAFLVLTTIETTYLVLRAINYFPQQHSLFPVWPEWHPEWALQLALGTLGLLFLPKIIAVLDVLFSGRRKDFGGFFALNVSVILEMIFSTLLAPIRMLSHTRYVIEALFNVSLRWAGQNRSDETRWLAAILDQGPGTIIALAWSGFAWWLDPMFFYWSLPISIPLILAAPTTVLLSRVNIGQWFRRRGLFITAEEKHGSELLTMSNQTVLTTRFTSRAVFVEAVLHPQLNQVHQQLARSAQRGQKQKYLLDCCQRCLTQGIEALTPKQITLLATHKESLALLHREAWQAKADSYWGRELNKRVHQ